MEVGVDKCVKMCYNKLVNKRKGDLKMIYNKELAVELREVLITYKKVADEAVTQYDFDLITWDELSLKLDLLRENQEIELKKVREKHGCTVG